MKLEDGTGNGFSAEVNAEKRLVASAVTSTEDDHNVDKGNGFVVNTSVLSVTGANETTLMYIKNNSDDPMFINSFRFDLGASTGGTGHALVSIVKNPTTGDIVTNANDCPIIENRNYGTVNPFEGDAYVGAYGETVISNGDKADEFLIASDSISTYYQPVTVILKKGSSMAINYTPQSANTAQDVIFSVTGFFQDIVV